MRSVLFLLVTLFSSFCIASQTPNTSDWMPLGSTDTVSYAILKSSVELDKETSSVQFVLRAVLATPTERGVQIILEQTLILCGPEIYVVVNQLQYDTKGTRISSSPKAIVIYNPEEKSSVVTKLIKLSCGTKV